MHGMEVWAHMRAGQCEGAGVCVCVPACKRGRQLSSKAIRGKEGEEHIEAEMKNKHVAVMYVAWH